MLKNEYKDNPILTSIHLSTDECYSAVLYRYELCFKDIAFSDSYIFSIPATTKKLIFNEVNRTNY